jgi:murein DD-endopeptidase MepM/ murein hydrolase activator NlpD
MIFRKICRIRPSEAQILKCCFTAVVFLTAALFVFSSTVSAKSLQTTIFPKKINPGDAFFIKLTHAKRHLPDCALLEGKEFCFAEYGKGSLLAIGAVGIETKRGYHIVRLKTGNRIRDLKLYVRKAGFLKTELTLPERDVILSPQDLARAKNDTKKLDEIFQNVSDKLWDGRFIKPLESDLSTPFGTKRIMNGEWVSVHKGVDLKGREGEDVRASNSGRVVLAEGLFFGGNTVVLDHGQGIYTIYMHLLRMNVNPGDTVSKGEVIGYVGSSGRATGPHLHFGVKIMDISVNPVSLWNLRL